MVALRADMDALEIEDLKDVSYKSLKPGLMHACGHDAHTAIQIGAAIILKKYEDNLGEGLGLYSNRQKKLTVGQGI
ncbi:M20/M25/M40 family metallo-hydrolase [Caloramator sp. Dgby_cultured_2]|nr:M20/M25/M40 family metallo-hydrolase [Caloramator sp. Dgby_cultured_2]WDU84455.1 M20/M25/M40 family metallo-hydrolase [Caloramator sp. Dgby_cultured_2]